MCYYLRAMRLSATLLALLATSLILAVVHISALHFTLYFHYWWFDIPMHILGGIVVALFFFALRAQGVLFTTRSLSLVPVIVLVLVVGLCWELFEIWAGIPLLEPDFERDIVSDLVNDMIGGVVGWYIGTTLHTRDQPA